MPAPPTATAGAASRDTLPQPAEPPVPDGPLIAVMLTELGPNAPAAEEAIARLPAGISLSFSPYPDASRALRSEEHTSELQSLMRISYAVFCLKKKKITTATRVQTKTECKHNKYKN